MSFELDPTKRQDMILKLGLEMIKLGFINEEITATMNSLQMIYVTKWLAKQRLERD